MTRSGYQESASPVKKIIYRWRMVFGAAAVLATCLVARYYWGARISMAQSPVAANSYNPAANTANPAGGNPMPAAQNGASADAIPADSVDALVPRHRPIPDIVAAVNGQQITRDELAKECRARFGREVLEGIVNKSLIMQECQQKGIEISRQEVANEIKQMAKSFNMAVDQWLKMLQEERNIRPDQYAEDVIWPSIALRKLAGASLNITPEEYKSAYEAEYGAAIKARVIICANLEKAKKLQAEAVANPDEFGNLAMSHSEDTPSACVKGLIQPIRQNGVCPEIEKAAFSMSDGEVSNVIASAGQYVILKRDGIIVPQPVQDAQVRPRLEKVITERKLRTVAGGLFKQLQAKTKVQNTYNDPVLKQQYPGIVALINGTPIYIRQLDEECMARHGNEVLEGIVNRRIIDNACRAKHVVITPEEINAEVARAALEMMKPLADGSPNLKDWYALVAENQGLTPEIYHQSIIWPAVALRKLAASKLEVTEDDINKGFEANYGPRVRCRAIVLNNARRAQQVWDKARQNPTVDNFGELAAKYSIEASSRSLLGEVPPIRHNGGQPVLEEEAFKLKESELSGVIQIDDKFIILFCEGYTKPIDVDKASVRDVLVADIREKKQRMAMSGYFAHLQEAATVDNFADPDASHAPRKVRTGPLNAVLPASFVAPAGAPAEFRK